MSEPANNITVAVRMRPLNAREKSTKDGSAACCELFPADATVNICDPTILSKGNKNEIKAATKSLTFDYLYDSSLDKDSDQYADQKRVFEDLGKSLCDKAFDESYNGCVFAYGLTGTGKTYTMMGYGDDKGLVPRVLDYVFGSDGVDGKLKKSKAKCQISYMELYNDKLRDLLDPGSDKAGPNVDPNVDQLQIRVHPIMGTYVSNLLEIVTNDRNKAEEILRFGDKMKSVASTNMNATSSRSHTIFTIKLTIDDETPPVRINLVDLAGRENEKNTAATGERLRELSFINKSLFELSNCIHALSQGSKSIPFRNNKLTMVLSDSLQGHSRTSMMAAVTPAAVSYADTLTTLRFAAATKTIKTKTVVSANASKADIIKALQIEITSLKSQIAGMKTGQAPSSGLPDSSTDSSLSSSEEIDDRLETDLEIIKQLKAPWSDAVEKTSKVVEMQKQLLSSLGIISKVDEDRELSNKTPFLMNISDDPYSYGQLLYFLSPKTRNNRTTFELNIGSDADVDDICLSGGLGVFPSMAFIQVKRTLSQKGPESPRPSSYIVSIGLNNSEDNAKLKGIVKQDLGLDPSVTTTILVNGKRLEESTAEEPLLLHHNDRIVVGHAMAFRVVIPTEVTSRSGSNVLFDQHKELFNMNIDASMPTSLEVVIAEIEDTQPTYLREFVDGVRKVHGDILAEALVKKIRQANYFVGEANSITAELRGHDRLSFKLTVIENVFNANKGSGANRYELMVRLLQEPLLGKSNRWAHIIKNRLGERFARLAKLNKNGDKSAPVGMYGATEEVLSWMALSPNNVSNDIVPTQVDVCIWTWKKFMARLQTMRDLYDRFHRDHLMKTHPVVGSVHHSLKMSSKAMKSNKPLHIPESTLLPETVAEYLEKNPQEDAWKEFGPSEVALLVGRNRELKQSASVLESNLQKVKSERDMALESLKQSKLLQIQSRVHELEADIGVLDKMARNLTQALHSR